MKFIIDKIKKNDYSLKSKLLFFFSVYYFPLVSFFLFLEFLYLEYYHEFGQIVLYEFMEISLMAIFIIYIITFFTLSYVIDKFILNRIKLVLNDFEKLKSGKMTERIKIDSYDEIGKLSYDANMIFDKFNNLLKLEQKNSLIDPLTLAYNRRALDINFISLVEKEKRDCGVLSLLMFDIDNFKKFNDTYGHDVGDIVLKELVKSVKKNLRKYDSLYRVGGEEFVVLFKDLNCDMKKGVLTRIRKDITYNLKKKIVQINGDITISGGFVTTKTCDLNSNTLLEYMMKIADENLYKAKNSGKNKIIAVG